MPTDKIVVRSADEIMADYQPIYSPIFPLFIGAKSVQYDAEVGKLNFKRLEAMGDIRAKAITPKDTEIRQVNASEGTKTFKKYFFANQFVQSTWQDEQGVEEVVKQVLDEHQLQMDELFLLGDGTAANNVVNNGLYWSGDANYTLETSYEVPTSERLIALHTKIVSNATKANERAGRKVLIVYGTATRAYFNSLYSTSNLAFKKVLADVLEGYTFVQMPAAVTPANAEGLIVANLDQTKTHYTLLPQLLSQGLNEEKMYVWSNFALGSIMLDVMVRDGVVRQPLTYAS